MDKRNLLFRYVHCKGSTV